jgi:hypothetical protein
MKMKREKLRSVQSAVQNFVSWLSRHGEFSFDHQSFFAGTFGRRAKEIYYRRPIVGTLAVAPMIFMEALIPNGRRLFGNPLRFPIADAHYAMGFALLAKRTQERLFYQRSVHFLEELKKSRCPGYRHYCWGYPFNWVTRNGTIPANTPFITTLPYVYEAFEYVHLIDKDTCWLDIMHSIAEHALNDIRDILAASGGMSCGYGPYDEKGGVVNASAYRAFLLTAASLQFSDLRYRKAAEGNILFVRNAQQADGSWPYALDGARDFIDHFHTCFVLKALAKIQRLTGEDNLRPTIQKGVTYYLQHLLDEKGLPKPFSVAPRLTVYRHELYDYAECINLCLLLRDDIPVLATVLENVVDDLLLRWIKKDGSFRSRELIFGWDNVPMHRWAQSQLFRSLAMLLCLEKEADVRPFRNWAG